jgi:hypothetical protein
VAALALDVSKSSATSEIVMEPCGTVLSEQLELLLDALGETRAKPNSVLPNGSSLVIKSRSHT